MPKSRKEKRFQVKGFRFAGVAAGIKGTGKTDLALIVSDPPAKATAVFTTCRLQAGPIIQGKKAIRGGKLRAVLINSGNANAATGKRGIELAFQTAALTGKALGIPAGQVLVSSTGKIGIPLDVGKIARALPKAIRGLSETALPEAARAIMTTDAFSKLHAVRGKIGNKGFTVAGFAKGAGMIEPHMATMLAYILTDLDLPAGAMRKAFRKAVEQSFNAITVDGDTSTNDTALLLASGASGIRLKPDTAGFRNFEKILAEVCKTLALMMVRDGEGATKVVEIRVRGARSDASARRMAYTIARSQLVKTSFFGEDPNWGRVFAALGNSGETFDPSRVDIYYGEIPLVRRGVPTGVSREAQAHKIMKNSSFLVRVELHQGKGRAQVWTSDLTYGYVKINAEYRT